MKRNGTLLQANDFIREADMRAIVRLLGEAAVVPGGVSEKRSYILNGLCDFAGAVEWRWTIFEALPSAPAPTRLLFLRGGSPLPPEVPPEYTLLSERQIRKGCYSRITLLRPPAGRPFTAREATAAHLVLDGLLWLHEQPRTKGDGARKLSPRLRSIEDLLLSGLSRKEIARRSGVTMGTVHGYVRSLYKHYAVHSHRELMQVRLGEPSASMPLRVGR